MAPSKAIQDQYLDSVARIRRRVEVYEADGVTPYLPTDKSYLVSGSVSVDYDRDERRALDLTLDNTDGTFDPVPGGFWYDKIIKVFRGIDLITDNNPPKIVIVEDVSGVNLTNLRNVLIRVGFYNIEYRPLAATLSDVTDADILVAMSNNSSPSKSALVIAAYNAGKSVVTIGMNATSAHYPAVISSTTALAGGVNIAVNKAPTGGQAEIVGFPWGPITTPSAPLGGTMITGLGANAKQAAYDSNTGRSTVVSARNPVSKGKWVHFHIYQMLTATPQWDVLIRSSMEWLDPDLHLSYWETQIGEFMIDSVEQARFPKQTIVRGRDYTKKLLNVKYNSTLQYGKTRYVEEVIQGIAIAAGIAPDRIVIPAARTLLGTRMTFDRGTTRWAAAKQLATSFGYEIFFDNVGNLILRDFRDPSTDPASFVFSEGAAKYAKMKASLVDYTRSANDTSIINQVLVTGESSDTAVLPVFYVANNTNPASSTNQAKLGVRSDHVSSPAITTTAQAEKLAKKLLAIGSLEEYQLSWTAICLDWLEAGDIVEVRREGSTIGPDGKHLGQTADGYDGSPVRYLMNSFTLPLDLGPMSASGKRTLIVK